MTLKNLDKAPFPWFGGKSRAAPTVWQLLGDVEHYVEPFAGSLAVLLNRPHPCNRPYYSETVNDLDALLVNAWRAIQWHPEETALHASWPVSENDKHARHIALVKWRDDKCADLLAGSPEWCDPKMAGWWVWGVCCQIGAFCTGGPWTADDTGRIARIKDIRGVKRDLPHVSDDGRGVNRPGTREAGVLSDDPGNEFHAHTMPELIRWFQWLSARLRHVRILNGDWARAVTTGVSHTISVRQGGHAGIFLDPPYDLAERDERLYSEDAHGLADDVRDWCTKNGDNPRNRIVLAGFDTEHVELENLGWTVHEWFTDGYMTGGLGDQAHRDRLWASPHCLTPAEPDRQASLFNLESQ